MRQVLLDPEAGMSGGMFLMRDSGELVEMRESLYDSEDQLQKWLASHPNLLAGDQVDPEDPRRWLLVCREAGVPGEEEGADRWSLDHLFLDQDAIPTLIEVKRSTDTRLRREVVGQMLDYAANAIVYWPVQRIMAMFEARCEREAVDSDEKLLAFLGEDEDPAQFWNKVNTNLQAGRVRMIFVADVIPKELQRVVEFLNGQMQSAEVLAVEVRRFEGPPGTEFRTIVPRVVGQTANSDRKRMVSAGKIPAEELLEKLSECCGPIGKSHGKRVIEWAESRKLQKGGTPLQIMFKAPDVTGKAHRLVSLRYDTKGNTPDGRLGFRLDMLEQAAAFKSVEQRKELIDRLTVASGAKVMRATGTFPFISLRQIDAGQLEAVLKVLDWAADLIKSH